MSPPLPRGPIKLLEFLIYILVICYHVGCKQSDWLSANEADEEFTHLLDRAATTRRVHLISELTRNGHRIQIEEYLDLSSWNQLIQFKWHEETSAKGDGESKNLRTTKINVIIMNTQDKRVMIQYEPLKCELRNLDRSAPAVTIGKSAEKSTTTTDWKEIMAASTADKPDNITISARQRHLRTLATILSAAPNSPYMSRVHTATNFEAWLFGIAGLWVRAQFYGSVSSGPPQQLYHFENNVKIKDSNSWRLELEDAGMIINYYFGGGFFKSKAAADSDSTQFSNAEYEWLSFIELRDSKRPHVVDLIDVIDIDFNFSDRLAADLFKLPIGFNCPKNSILNEPSNSHLEVFDIRSRSKLIEFEIVATKYADLGADKSLYSATGIKTLIWAAAKHPINSIVPLIMYEVREDRLRVIRDFHSRLMYTIKYDHFCDITRLHIFDFDHRQAFDPVEINFNIGITLSLTEVIIDYILDPKVSDKNEMRYLNRITASPTKEEHVFESEVPKYFEKMVSVKNSAHEHIAHKLSIVRVYDRSMRQKTRLLKLSRVILIVFDYSRQEKLAELRLNFIKKLDLLSFTRRAHIFDISECYNHDESSMELVVYYPAEPSLINHAQDKGHQMIEEFYKAPLAWWAHKSELADGEWNLTQLEKKRLALSLNFLRIPKAELRNSVEGELELHLTIIDKPSPADTFLQLEKSTFKKKPQDEVMLVESLKECAKFCQQLKCQMFAYDSASHECKLSPLTFENYDDSGDINVDSVTMPVYRSFSKIYYNQGKVDTIDWQAPADEASLAELHSYLEHSVSEYSNFAQDYDDEDEIDFSPYGGRQNESNSISKWPLMSFQFNERDSSREFQPPIRRLLVPSEIRVARLPITLDVLGESQAVKVAEAFRSKEVGRFYRLVALDNFDLVPRAILTADERTFISRSESAYYTLKRLHAIELAYCARMCYNIEEWDKEAAAEQTCVSYSHCQFERQCVLMIRTDFAFVKSILELTAEGDIVHEINSTSQLQYGAGGCIINDRNYITGFVGPLTLDPNFFANRSTKDLNFKLKHEWLNITKNDPSVTWLEDGHEECAKQCTKSNHAGRMCIAFDYCNLRVASPQLYRGSQLIMRRNGYSCNMLSIINGDTEMIGSEISNIRGQLTRHLKRPETIDQDEQNVTTMAFCKRYLVSHLNEFDLLRQRQLSTIFKQNQLDGPASVIKNLNLDTCSSECSVRLFGCLAFEYCNKFDEETSITTTACSLYGYEELSVNSSSSEDLSIFVDNTATVYSADCHVYVRSNMKSLSTQRKSDKYGTKLDGPIIESHSVLIIVFLALYVAILFTTIHYARTLDNPNTPMSNLLIRMNDLLNQRERTN